MYLLDHATIFYFNKFCFSLVNKNVENSESSKDVIQLQQEIEFLKVQLNQKQLEINAKNEEITQRVRTTIFNL